jgi:hypothetical protein
MRLKVGDFFIFGAVALLAAGSFLLGLGARSGDGRVLAEIRQNGRLVRTVDLGAADGAVRYELGGDYRIVLVAEHGRIRFLSSDCPDQVCVRTGWLTAAGQSAACVPGRVLVRLTGASVQDVVVR